MDQLPIEVPCHIKTDRELTEWVQENPNLFEDAMDLDASQFDDRATVDEVRITKVEIDNMSVEIHYEYDYSAYYGCKDMISSGTINESVIVGTRHGLTILFDKFKSMDRRSTEDEF